MGRLTKKQEDGTYDACHHYYRTIVDKLGELEDAEEQGLLAKVVHGKWIIDICSLCGEEAPNDGYWKSPYCPNCGAKMDGKEEGVKNG